MSRRQRYIALALLLCGGLSYALLSHPVTVKASACVITTNTTVDQTYITTNTCNTIDISGTTTVTWSGTTDLVGDGTVTISSGTVTFSGAVVLGATDSLVIASGATVTHAVADTTGVNITAANLTVNGLINVNAKGCAGAGNSNGYGPNTSTGVCAVTTSGYGTLGSQYGAGGSHGGLGTAGNNGLGGTTYGSDSAPTLLGSAGGALSYSHAGGNGGGKIILSISGALTNAGVISATGGAGVVYNATANSGGGSGGSVYVTAGTLAGAGTITATGGERAGAAPSASGGGGRVAVYYTVNDGFTLANITAAAGTGASNGSTFILDQTSDNLTVTSGLDFQSGGDYTRANITVASGARLTCGSFATLNVGATSTLSFAGITWSCDTVDAVNISAATWTTSGTNTISFAKAGAVVDWDIASDLTLNNLTYTGGAAGTSSANGGVLSMDNAISLTMVNTDIISSINFTGLSAVSIDSQSSIAANAKGCAGAGNSDGYGPNTSTGVCTVTTSGYGKLGSQYGAGGSHGGLGTAGNSGLGGTTYGSNSAPTLLGSAGGALSYSHAGGNGGGKIRLSISGTLTNAGAISATGGPGVVFNATANSGSGSGGSVYVTAGTLAGAGTISATGGERAGTAPSASGGGGRVAVYYTGNDGFTLANITAAAGTGASAGTVYTFQYTVASTPSISSPSNASYNASVNATITSSTYSSNGASHTTSDWKITTDVGGSTTVWSKDADASNLTSIVVNIANGTFSGALAGQTELAANTVYYAFVRYNNSAGASAWSTAISFTTITTTNTATKTWDFGTSSDYTSNATYATVTGGVGQLTDLGGGTYSSAAPAAMSSWAKRKTITVTEASGSTLTNFQTKVIVTYDADMNADFSDIRFTSNDGSTLLDHWLESKTNSVTATFWVEIPTLTASSATTIYVYYGNAAAASVSSGANTFTTFDDFDDGDYTGWTITREGGGAGTVTITSGQAVLAGGGTPMFHFIKDSPTNLQNFIYETDVKVTDVSGNNQMQLGQSFRVADTNNLYTTGMDLWESADTVVFGRRVGGSWGQVTNAVFASVSGTTYKYTTSVNGTAVKFSIDGVQKISSTDSNITAAGKIGFNMDFGSSGATDTIVLDNVRVRQFASTEPSASVGSEVTLATYDQVSITSAVASVPSFTGLGTFTETRGVTGGQGSTYYNLSLDGVNWKYWNGTVWAAASSGNYNAATVVNDYLPQFTTDIGTGSLYFKAFLVGSSQPVEINTLVVTYASINVSLTASTQTVAESAGTVTVTAQLSTTSGSTVTIPYTISGTATAGGTDHNLANGNIVITAGLTTGDATFSVINDAIDENDETVIVTLGAPDVGSLSGVTEQTVTITDNDTSGFTVGTISGNTTEAGGTATATVVLTSLPSADVSIGLTSSNTAEGTVSPASFTFTTLNWSTPQTLTVTGVNDAIDDGDILYSIVTAAATSADSLYNNINPGDVAVTNTDNDTAGITIGGISGHTTEAGGTATFTAVLDSQPTASVSIGISSSNTAEGTVAPISLSFTTINWATPQTVTATGVNDFSDDGDVVYSIVIAAATSVDGNYSGLNPADVSVTNDDNDAAGVTVSALSGNTTEAGGTATFTLVLDSIPSGDVSIGLSSADTTEGTVLPSSVTFTAGDWNTPQTITVTGVDDALDDGDVLYSIITAAAVSLDLGYDSLNPANAAVTNTDNDTAGVTVSSISGATTEAGVTATFTAVLNTEPTADVTFGLSSSNTAEGTVAPTSLTFTTGNWSVAQTVTVTGVNDDVDDGNIDYTIILAAATSADSVYNTFNPSDVSVTNTDNDTFGITVSTISGTTTEAGGTATATIVLTSQPTGDVTIGLTSSNTAEGMVSPASFTFTAGNWSVAQTVTATGVNDSVDDGNIGYSIITAAATSVDVNYSGVNPSNIAVTNVDNDTAGIVLTESADTTEVKEGDYTDSYTIVFATEPTAPVTVTIASTASEADPSPAMLTFTSLNWATPQTVTVTAIDDFMVEVSQSDSFTNIVTSADPLYDGLAVASVTVAMTDNDHSSSALPPSIFDLPKTLTVEAPAASANILEGSSMTVSWSYTGQIPVVSVYLSTDAGTTWTLMRYGITNNGSTTFLTPFITTSQALVKVEGSDLVTILATATSNQFSLVETLLGSPLITPVEVVVTPEAVENPTEVAAHIDAWPVSVALNMLVKVADDGDPTTQHDAAVYSIGADGFRHAFPNERVFLTWYSNFDDVKIISAADLGAVTLGSNIIYKPGSRMIKFETSPKVYAIDVGSVLRWVTNEAAAADLYGNAWNMKIDIVSDALFGNYVQDSTISSRADYNPDGFTDILDPSDAM